jgi:pyridinium-3,5-bisthiocarboxylic acid mononucleotide nickel chelatase
MGKTVAILDPFSGIAGDMTLGALVAVGLDADFVRGLPSRLGIEGIGVKVDSVVRAGISCVKVDFEIPPQPHGRHLKHIRAIIDKCDAPTVVKERADAVFTLLTTVEAHIHGTTVERVHLHEVGAVDAILDVVGSVWGFELLGVDAVHCGPMYVGDGSVHAQHGEMQVPAPATLKLLEGLTVRTGPAGAGELVTPTGAALVKVLSSGAPPNEFRPLRSGYGAGTKDFPKRANALRLTIAELIDGVSEQQPLVELVADIDDMSPEYLAGVADALRDDGALDVIITSTIMKRGRPGMRIEVLCPAESAARFEARLFAETSTLGVRRRLVGRTALDRSDRSVEVLGHPVSVKIAVLSDGSRRAKPEFLDVQRVALATGRPLQDIFRLALTAAERP